MKCLFRIIILTSILSGYTFSAHAQTGRNRPASARAAYGDTAPTSFKANSKKNQKKKKKARKAAKRKKGSNNNQSYWSGKPF